MTTPHTFNCGPVPAGTGRSTRLARTGIKLVQHPAFRRAGGTESSRHEGALRVVPLKPWLIAHTDRRSPVAPTITIPSTLEAARP